MGIIFSVIALLAWGVGDFLIQRSARKFGNWIAIFYITAFASIALLPFVYKEILPLIWNEKGLMILLIASIFLTFASYFDFEGLRLGKISVIEPIFSLDIAVTAILSIFVIKENLSIEQIALVVLIIISVFLVSTKSFQHLKNIKWEKGVFYAITATLLMGAVNFLFGVGARDTSPLLINWFTSVFLAIVSFGFLLSKSQAKNIILDFKNNSKLILSVSVIDNLAWVAYAYATLYIPIAIATSISEVYIAIAVYLGLKINKEKIKTHQILGLLFAIIAAVVLSAITLE